MNAVFPKLTLKAARINQNLTQIQAANALGVSVSTIQNYELGNSVPNWNIVQKMEELYKVSADYLIFGQNYG